MFKMELVQYRDSFFVYNEKIKYNISFMDATVTLHYLH